MKIHWLILILTFIVFSCKAKNTEIKDSTLNANQNDTLIALQEIHALDSTLVSAYIDITDTLPLKLIEKVINAQNDFAVKYPNHPYAPEALDKMHQLYLQSGNYHFSTEYGELLIKKYPNYKNINQVMYSLATSYDFMLNNKTRAIELYKELLTREKVTQNTKNEINERLKQLKS
jgi:tetratricopeptide (TPR) repeat protein